MSKFVDASVPLSDAVMAEAISLCILFLLSQLGIVDALSNKQVQSCGIGKLNLNHFWKFNILKCFLVLPRFSFLQTEPEQR